MRWIRRKKVGCNRPHTTEIVSVHTIPATRPLPTTVKQAHTAKALAFVNRECQKPVDNAIGGTASRRAASWFGSFWWYSSPAEAGHGARWIACSVGLSWNVTSMSHGHLVPIPAKTPLLAHGGAGARYTKCNDGHQWTTCAQPHAWRATASFEASGAWSKGLGAQGGAFSQRCAARLHTSTTDAWPAWVPTKRAWGLGDHRVICFLRTNS